MSDVFGGIGVEVLLSSPDAFLKIKETLTRLGVASERTHTLYQSCHILHKRGKYAIVHFKELFVLDGKAASITPEDYERRDAIASLLNEWNLLAIEHSPKLTNTASSIRLVKVIPFKDKKLWTLVSKYQIGVNKHHES